MREGYRTGVGIIAISHDTVSYDLSQPGFLLEFCDFKSRGVGCFSARSQKNLDQENGCLSFGMTHIATIQQSIWTQGSYTIFWSGSRCSMFCDSSGFFEDIGSLVCGVPMFPTLEFHHQKIAGKMVEICQSVCHEMLLRLTVMGSNLVNLPPDVSAWICFLRLDERIFT